MCKMLFTSCDKGLVCIYFQLLFSLYAVVADCGESVAMRYYSLDLHRRRHYKMRRGVYPSVCLSVACLDLTRERKGLGSPKLVR